LEEHRCEILGAALEIDSVTAIPEMERLGPQKPNDFAVRNSHSQNGVENRIKEGTVEGLRAAMQVDPRMLA
jgi:hypothetical protein